jgi:hypothetical protein
MLVGGRDCRTQFWEGITNGPFHQSLVFKIEQFWPFEEIFIFSHGGHLGYRTAQTDTILKAGHTRIISAKFG